MNEIRFREWAKVLAQADVPGRQKASWVITLKWFLGYCRRSRAGVTVQSAREFIEWAQQEKDAQPWQVEGWKEAIRWFFRAAKASGCGAREPSATQAGQATAHAQASTAKCPCEGNAGAGRREDPAWKTAFLTVVRRRHYSYRTEQSYLVWLERFARFCRTDDLAGRGPEDVKKFLDALALDQRLSASSQRQALNAVVFVREVFGKEMGDFSDYRRAKTHPHSPAWLTPDEVQALLDRLEDRWALLASVAFGSGLRLMELLRLRVESVDLEQEIITVRSGKGGKDRFVPLAQAVLVPLRAHLEKVRRCFKAIVRHRLPESGCPKDWSANIPKPGKNGRGSGCGRTVI